MTTDATPRPNPQPAARRIAERGRAKRLRRAYSVRALSYAATAVALAAVALPVLRSGWTAGPDVHSALEAAAATLALLAGLMALVRYYTRRTDTFLLVAVGFLGAGILDLAHLVFASGWYPGAPPVAGVSVLVWTWSVSRLYLGIMLGAAFLTTRGSSVSRRVDARKVYAAGAALVALGLALPASGVLPPITLERGPIARPQELVAAVLFAMALGNFLATRRWEWDDFEHWLVLSLVVAVVGQAFYVPFSREFYDTPLEVAHVLKLASYGLVLAGLLANMSRLFTQAERSSELLAARNEELMRSNRELEQFSSAISHDLQEPLRVISGYTQLLGRRYRGRLDGEADEFIDFTVEATGRMRDHIQGLLEYSRVGRAARQVTLVDLEATLADSVRALQQAVAESGAQVTHSPLPRVTGNPRLLERLLTNLIGNAIKYRSDAPPRVNVSARRVRDGWEIRVQDNGQGIEPEYRERIFGLFQRLHTREEYPGSGIGLAVCRRIAEAHGGEIRVESFPGEGSTFIVTLRSIPAGTRDAATAAG